jgi:hypothetical protein
MSVHGVRGLYFVQLRAGRRYVRLDLQPLDGRVFAFRPGWQLGPEHGGIYAGELAMVSVDTDPEHPYPPDAPIWIASGDLRPIAEVGAEPKDLVERAA